MPAIDQQWNIAYEAKASSSKLLTLSENQFIIYGDVSRASVKKLLVKRLKITAQLYLINRLQKISEQLNMPYETAIIRDQKTKWGSCSSRHVIMLHYKLLFLPPALVDHVIIHELCHTVHFNHSKDFWQLLKSFDPFCYVHRKQLKAADGYVPKWLA